MRITFTLDFWELRLRCFDAHATTTGPRDPYDQYVRYSSTVIFGGPWQSLRAHARVTYLFQHHIAAGELEKSRSRRHIAKRAKSAVTLAAQMGCCGKTVYESVKRLERAQLIEVEHCRWRHNVYRARFNAELRVGSEHRAGVCGRAAGPFDVPGRRPQAPARLVARAGRQAPP